jgi:hypothetical protein
VNSTSDRPGASKTAERGGWGLGPGLAEGVDAVGDGLAQASEAAPLEGRDEEHGVARAGLEPARAKKSRQEPRRVLLQERLDVRRAHVLQTVDLDVRPGPGLLRVGQRGLLGDAHDRKRVVRIRFTNVVFGPL